MTYWADNIRFIKEVQDSKYQKIEEAIDKVSLFLFNFYSFLYTNLDSSIIEARIYTIWNEEVLRFFNIVNSEILSEVDFMHILNSLKGNKPFYKHQT